MQFILVSLIIAGYVARANAQISLSEPPQSLLSFTQFTSTYPPPSPTQGPLAGAIVGPTDDRIYTTHNNLNSAYNPTDDQVNTLPEYLVPTPNPTEDRLTIIGDYLTPSPSPSPTQIPPTSLLETPTQTLTGSIFYNQQEDSYNYLNSILDSSKPYISSIQFETELGAILPRQITPSVDDTVACRSFWDVWPEGYNGSQVTHCYPLSAIGRLSIYFDGKTDPIPCTGSLIGPRTVITAAHCFTQTQERLNKNFTNVEFTPGQFGDYKPFGSFSNGVVFTPDVKFNKSQDYAVVKFSEEIGNLTGWLGIEYKECGNKTYDITVAGYSEDKSQDKMWTSKCDNTFIDPCLYGGSSGTFQHTCDTNPGTSGASLFENNIIVGIHQGGQSSTRINVATFISRELMNFISIHQN